MSSFGGIDIPVEDWGIDFIVSSANKCIRGCPASLRHLPSRTWKQPRGGASRARPVRPVALLGATAGSGAPLAHQRGARLRPGPARAGGGPAWRRAARYAGTTGCSSSAARAGLRSLLTENQGPSSPPSRTG
ncbi:MAG: hypothetical protein ACLT98_18510 [Eggerthellaceae bacterium]